MSGSNRSIIRFADLSEFLAQETADPSDNYATAFAETADQVRLARMDEAISADMPDPFQAERGVELVMTTLFDLLRDSRLEQVAERLAWGIVHSFHKVADQLAGEADRAAMQVGQLIGCQDGSEIATIELEEAQTLCHGLDEARDAVSCMRDHAAAIFHSETGRPWAAARATLVSSKRTASVIAATDFLAARRMRRMEQEAPRAPIVIFSGGPSWEDDKQVWSLLDTILKRIPTMLLATTAQERGGDAIAASWAASRKVKLVTFDLSPWRKLGKRAGFARNERLLWLKPAEVVVCEGNGLQAHLERLAREGGFPAHFLRADEQQRRDWN